MVNKDLSSINILEKLINFPTISRTPNIELIQWVADLLESFGIKFAKKDIAYKFGIETFLKEYKSTKAFTFHKWFKHNKKYPKFIGKYP